MRIAAWAGFLSVCLAAPACAQEGAETTFEGDYLTVGAGISYGPSYDGSDDYKISPIPVVQGSYRGIAFNARAGGIAVDFIDGEGKSVDFDLGPVVRMRRNRSSSAKDPVVESAGELDSAIEIGPSVGIDFDGVLHGYDNLSFGTDVRWDVAGAHGGMVIDPTISYFTPLSRAFAVNLSLSAEHGDASMLDYYYSVTPAQSLASGLPVFDADGGGWIKAGGSAMFLFDLDGDLENGGFVLAAMAGYVRMLGDAKRSPFTSVRGDADQWVGGMGVGYTF